MFILVQNGQICPSHSLRVFNRVYRPDTDLDGIRQIPDTGYPAGRITGYPAK